MIKSYTLFLFALLIVGITGHAQNVGINNDASTPDASAMLDIKSSSKGILIPRVALTGTNDVTTIPAPQVSLLIYNTATINSGATSVEPGYYYWSGSSWIKIMTGESPSASAWKMGGNTGTTPGTHFIGTTDNKPLVFKVNNQLSGHIDNIKVNTFFGYQAGQNITTGYGSIGIGQNALMNATGGFDNIAIGEGTLASLTNSFDNIAIGKFAMTGNTTGSGNLGLGHAALNTNTAGSHNIGIGQLSLFSNTTGSENTGLGYHSLVWNTGSFNTGLGNHALFYNSTGSRNTAIGDSALIRNYTGSANTAIGHGATTAYGNLINATAIGARAYANCNNCVVLGSVKDVNNATNNVNVGIGTATPSASLDVRRTSNVTANFFGSAVISHFNFGEEENTFIRGGKIGSHVLINDYDYAGNVGIGTGTPAHKLDVNGDIGYMVANQPNLVGDKTIFFTSNTNSKYGIGVQHHLLQIFIDEEASDLAFGFGTSANFTEKIRLKGNGRIGIGTSDPAASLDVRRTTNTTANFYGSGIISHFNFGDDENTYIRGGKIGAQVLINDFSGAGNVGIGTSAPGAKLDVAGTVRCTNLVQTSDARLKTNIIPIASSLHQVSKLNGYRYQWKDTAMGQSIQVGLLAQEVREIFPELVHTDDKGMLAVNYQGLVPVLVEAIKELKKENEELKKLKDEVAELKKLISNKK